MTEEQSSTENAATQPESASSPVEPTADTPAQAAPAPQPEAAPAEEPPKKPRARKQSTAKKTRTVELTLTVTGTADGEWQADLMHAGKRVVQGLPIAAAAVSKAAAELHQDISETIEGVINQARQQHEAKLAELEAEVERVRKALAELEG
ncbi:DUF6319 family protein [Saccharopolyspora hirsuta]|uniref:Mucin n=1 Tax=Saccharopolyspora hirsuta TaxID=1837 RepID=A0A5M7C4Y3_SACHI|nr:DUF6319 family protein [Saccharopolyspora hirsuta]KAA5833405.1 hypothetical protein F1721_14010 [Saccharopolyspora hirsuta]MBF6507922.1 hypothetical protein [Nocardia farcinica]